MEIKIVKNFKFKLNRNQIIKSLRSYGEILDENELTLFYNSMLPILYQLVQPVAIFDICANEISIYNDKYQYIVPCIITAGTDVDKKIGNYFSDNRPKEGLVLDAMCTSYLFEISSQLFNHIYENTTKMNLGLSCRISPGDDKLPLKYQKNILDRLNIDNILDLNITENYMLTSMHSMTYIYGADKNIKLNKFDHNCVNCKNKEFCTMRKDLI